MFVAPLGDRVSLGLKSINDWKEVKLGLSIEMMPWRLSLSYCHHSLKDEIIEYNSHAMLRLIHRTVPCLIFNSLILNRVSLYSPGWLRINCVDMVDLEFA